MSMFDLGQAAAESLTDEAIYAEPEGQEEAAPQEEQINDAQAAPPAQAPESEPAEAAAPQDGQAAPEQVKAAAAPPQDPKQYQEMWQWNTRVAMENGMLRQRVQALEQERQQGEPAPPAEDRDFVRRFLQQPEQALRPIVEQAAAQKAQALVAPLLQREEEARRSHDWQRAYQSNAEIWPQLNDRERQKQLVAKLVELSLEDGDRELWQKRPQRYIPAAAMALWGVPVKPDQAAIDAALKAVEENRQTQAQNKAGLAIMQPANRSVEQRELSPEEQIVAEMRAAQGGAMFG